MKLEDILFFKTEQGFVFRLEDVWYIEVVNGEYYIHMHNDNDFQLEIVDYMMLTTKLMSVYQNYYMCDNGFVFNLCDIMSINLVVHEELEQAGVYIYNGKHEDTDTCIVISKNDYDIIINKLNIC